MKKKSLLALLLTVAMVSGLLAGCGSDGKKDATTAAATEAAKETAGETAAAGDVTTAAAEDATTAAAETEGPAATGDVNTVILKEADDKMINTYTVIAVNPEAPFTDGDGNAVSDVAVNTAGADALIQFLLSEEGKTAAAEFGQTEFGDSLFYLLEDAPAYEGEIAEATEETKTIRLSLYGPVEMSLMQGKIFSL